MKIEDYAIQKIELYDKSLCEKTSPILITNWDDVTSNLAPLSFYKDKNAINLSSGLQDHIHVPEGEFFLIWLNRLQRVIAIFSQQQIPHDEILRAVRKCAASTVWIKLQHKHVELLDKRFLPTFLLSLPPDHPLFSLTPTELSSITDVLTLEEITEIRSQTLVEDSKTSLQFFLQKDSSQAYVKLFRLVETGVIGAIAGMYFDDDQFVSFLQRAKKLLLEKVQNVGSG